MSILADRLLVVEGDACLRGFLTRVLVEWGYAVKAVPDSQEAIESLDSSPFSLCLIDAVLPDGSGIDLCRRIRSFGHRGPLVIACREKGDQDLATNAGADACVRMGAFVAHQLQVVLIRLIGMGWESERPVMCYAQPGG